MGKVQYIKKSRKPNICGKCGKEILVGSPYKKGVINFHKPIIRCMNCGLQPWEVTTSEYLLNVGEIVYNWHDNIGISEDVCEEISSLLGDILSELDEKINNMPDSLRYSETGELLDERYGNVDNAINEIDSIDVESIKDEIWNDFLESKQDDPDFKYYVEYEGYQDFLDRYVGGYEIKQDLAENLENKLAAEIDEALGCLEV